MPPIHAPLLASSPLVVFGKTPWMGDFLHVGTAGRAGDAFEQWVHQGLTRAESRVGASWPPAYAHGAMHAFIFRQPRTVGLRETLVGVILPSTDAVGRSFPLAIYAPVPLSRGEFPLPHLLPLVLGEFFDAAAETLLGAGELAGPDDLVQALLPLPPPGLDRTESDARDYETWANGARLVQAWSVVYGPEGVHHAQRAIHVIADAVAPFRGEPAPATTLGLRLPLGSGGIASAAFWLDMVRRLAGSPNEVRTAFWSFDGERGSMIVQLGETPASTLTELWAPDADGDLCDLTDDSNIDVTRLRSTLPRAIHEAIHSPEVLVSEFLERLSR